MFIVIWEYQVKSEHQPGFEEVYSSSGAWVELFKNGEGYLGTELLHSTEAPGQYITIDRWDSKENYESFLSQWKAEHERLDGQYASLAEHEGCLGRFRSELS
jgi:heme-degrading monooxygenase HmoA